MQTKISTSTSSPSHANILALYYFLWQQQDHSVLRQGLKSDVIDLEDYDCAHPFTFDAIDLSRHSGIKLPNGAISMLIRSDYEPFFNDISTIKRNFIVHGSAGIGKTHFLLYILVRRLLARQPVTYQIDKPGSCVLCFTQDGFFTIPEENSEQQPLFQREDVWHLIDSTQQDPTTHKNTEHTRALMWSTCGKTIFTTFWPDKLGFDVEWSPGYDVALQRWLSPCAWDEIFAMSTLTAHRHDAKVISVHTVDYDARCLRWAYIHFGSNARVCLQVSQHPGSADHYLRELECANDDFWNLHSIQRQRESQFSRSLFAVQAGENRTEPLSYPVSQVASRLLADGIVTCDSCAAKGAVDDLIHSPDTKEAGENYYGQIAVSLMSIFGGTFELRCPDSQGHYHSAHEDLVLRGNLSVTYEARRAISSRRSYCTEDELAMLAEEQPNILHSPKYGLLHPGIDAIMFDANNLTVWLVQVTYESPRAILPQGLLFLLNTVRGSAYEPSPLRPWKLIFVTRGPVTSKSFQLSGTKNTQLFSSMFWNPRVEPYVMQLRDIDRDLYPTSSPYVQWGFPFRSPRKSPLSLMRRLANSLTHIVHKPRDDTGTDLEDQKRVELWSSLTRTSGVPGAHLLGEMTSEQGIGSNVRELPEVVDEYDKCES